MQDGAAQLSDTSHKIAVIAADGIGIAPSADINPTGQHPALFDPVHGLAPDITGEAIANPIGLIGTAALMRAHLDHAKAAAPIVADIKTALQGRTRDLGAGPRP